MLALACVSCSQTENDLLEGRTFQTLVPPQVSDDAPIVVVLHGYTASAQIMIDILKLQDQADITGAIFVVPDGLEDNNGLRYWNSQGACCDFSNVGIDDVGFIRALVESTLASQGGIDRKVVLIGHSNGGFMSHRLACNDETQMFSAIATVAGVLPTPNLTCARSKTDPLRVLHIHGTNDAVIAYDGGQLPGGPYPTAVATAEFWAGFLGCDATIPEPSSTIDLDANQEGAESDVIVFNCSNVALPGGVGAPNAVEHWRTNNGGHVPIPTPGYLNDVLDFLLPSSE